MNHKMTAIRIPYKACPHCTYPLKSLKLDDEYSMTVCTNSRCGYSKKIKRRKKNGN